jgi:branched-chain amino acid transport system ATP-binding protein
LEIADRAYVLENGKIALEGTGHDVLNNPHMKAAYLGH